ncbi:hypothetical protein Hanom_Chr17g01560901 [Helianthus anomalus]
MRWLLSLAREMVILEGIHLNSLSGNLLFFGRGIRNNSGRTLGTLYSFFSYSSFTRHSILIPVLFLKP